MKTSFPYDMRTYFVFLSSKRLRVKKFVQEFFLEWENADHGKCDSETWKIALTV